jgi:hypothetical protein
MGTRTATTKTLLNTELYEDCLLIKVRHNLKGILDKVYPLYTTFLSPTVLISLTANEKVC